MILSGHQPAYLPGIIVFNKIALSDRHMFVGHCDYQPKSWHSRNFIRGPNGPVMLTVPVVKGRSINDTVPSPDSHWRNKHLKAIEHAYSKRPYFNHYWLTLKALINFPAANLSDFNIAIIHQIMDWLGITTETYRSEDFNITGHKTEMLVNMCKAMGADHYLSSPGEQYVDKELFSANGLKHSFQQFEHPLYAQGAKFMPNLSVIDLLFNVGPDAGAIVKGCGRAES